MAHTGGFKVPTMVPQDLAMIMELVDPPRTTSQLEQGAKVIRATPNNSGLSVLTKADSEFEDDIASSGTESEDEVEAEVAPENVRDAGVAQPDESEDADSESSSTSSSTSYSRQAENKAVRKPVVIDLDFDEDGPPPAAYVPSVHELALTAIPVPSLPDPSTLPPDPVEYVGEIVSVLPDTVIVRGGGSSGTGHMTSHERRDAALDEGSLLFFQDRTMLGYVWETFGPTSLPHYVVRTKRAGSSTATAVPVLESQEGESVAKTSIQSTSGVTNDADQKSVSVSEAISSDPDLSRIKISTPIYHIPSLSRFVFPGALARLKGSDASNVHDEEPADHELEFSDDEAEAAHKRHRNRSSSRALSSAPHQEEVAMSTADDDASSLYGESPYDFDDVSVQSTSMQDTQSSSGYSMDLSTQFEDPAVRDALMHARNSRSRRPSSASVSDTSHIASPSYVRDDPFPSTRGRGRGRGRRVDRPRRGHVHDRNMPAHGGRGRGQVLSHAARQTHAHDQATAFSFDEYDPHMPRPPSPTSLAIARATGQWMDGTPFPYQNGPPNLQPIQPYEMQYQAQGYYPPVDNTFGFSPTHEHNPVAQSYPVAPHINPRFAQAFGISGGAAGPSSVQPTAAGFQAPALGLPSQNSPTDERYESIDSTAEH